MSNMRKPGKKYYFSVEGETEQYYLEWLRDTINASPKSKIKVKLDCRIQKDPVKRVKSMNIHGKTEITHIFDRESEEPVHVEEFITTLLRMKEAERCGKTVIYNLGYSNFTFELWIVLHKADCNGAKAHRSYYLELINRIYGEQFETLDHYKHEKNFKRILSKLTINDVQLAIKRSKTIMQRNQEKGYTLQRQGKYYFYKENPSLSIWESIEKILSDCGLLF